MKEIRGTYGLWIRVRRGRAAEGAVEEAPYEETVNENIHEEGKKRVENKEKRREE